MAQSPKITIANPLYYLYDCSLMAVGKANSIVADIAEVGFALGFSLSGLNLGILCHFT